MVSTHATLLVVSYRRPGRALAPIREWRQRDWSEEAGLERRPLLGCKEPVGPAVLGEPRGEVDVVELLPGNLAAIEISDAVRHQVGDLDLEPVLCRQRRRFDDHRELRTDQRTEIAAIQPDARAVTDV